MNTTRPCGCKGYRTCLLCEADLGIRPENAKLPKTTAHVYCPQCNQAFPGWDWLSICKAHPNHNGIPIFYPGVFIQENFLSEAEEQALLDGIDSIPWDASQSGRRKQNYGPKCNFKKQKLKLGTFKGFPKFSEFVQHKFESVPVLRGFQTIEQCSLEYDPERGASIDPHIDDCWIWGERIVSVNLLSDSVLTMTFNKKRDYYNLDCVSTYPAVLNNKGLFNTSTECYKLQNISESDNCTVVRIPMPRRSLLVIYNSARYDWEHQILREDIQERRICLAYREFTPPYLAGSEGSEANAVLEEAKKFW